MSYAARYAGLSELASIQEFCYNILHCTEMDIIWIIVTEERNDLIADPQEINFFEERFSPGLH